MLSLAFLCPLGGQATGPQTTILRFAGGEIEITLPDEQLAVSSSQLMDWIKTAAGAVSEYYGRFPVPHLTLRVRSGPGW